MSSPSSSSNPASPADGGNGGSGVMQTPVRNRGDNENDNDNAIIMETPVRRGLNFSSSSPTTTNGVAQTPSSNSGNNDDSIVPATPTVPATPVNGGGVVPGTPLTPLSEIDGYGDINDDFDEHNNHEMMGGEQQQQGGEDDDDGVMGDDDQDAAAGGQRVVQRPTGAPQPMFDDDQQEMALIRGTDVHVPTAAAAFTDFLRNFKSLPKSRNSNNNGDDTNDDSSMEEDDYNDDDDNNEQPPLYLSRLESLLTEGVMRNNNGSVDDIYDDVGGMDNTTSLDVDTMHIYFHSAECQKFYHQLVAYPMEMVPLMDLIVQREIQAMAQTLLEDDRSIIPSVQVRPYNLKQVSNIRCLDPVSLDSMLCVRGMVLRTSPIIPDLKIAHFMCCICGDNVQVQIDRGRIQEPNGSRRCTQCNTSDTYQLIHNRCMFADKQLVRLQETPDEVPAGQTPASIVTFCFDDLVDSVKPGDKVEITGVLRAQPNRINPKITKLKSVYKTYLDVIHFKRITGMQSSKLQKDTSNNSNSSNSHNKERDGMEVRFTKERIAELKKISQRKDIYEQLTTSLAPSIWELDNVKKGVLCMLFGGNHVRVKKKKQKQKNNNKSNIPTTTDDLWGDMDQDNEDNGENFDDEDDDTENDGTHKLNKRGDINILLCGDPGTSKSQLLTYVNKLSTRGIYTSGKGSSAVGLTASVVKDPETRDIVLESGALVLSDLGICAIDEFDKMSDTTRSVLHEAMEQQTVSIAKAGIIASLNARTSILASANPTESRYNPNKSVVENIKLPPTLLSRFDLIYLVLDNPSVDYDRRLAQHLVGLYYETPNVCQPPLDQQLLRDYIDYARENIFPELSDEATEFLLQSYLEMRNPLGSSTGGSSNNGNHTISATPRQLESLIRLSEALAKMRYSNVVTKDDAKEAVRLMRVATQTAATDPRTGRIDMDMIATGRSTTDRELEEQLSTNIKQLLSERRGNRLGVRDISRQLLEVANITAQNDEIVSALRSMENDGIIQFNERAQTVFVRSGIVH